MNEQFGFDFADAAPTFSPIEMARGTWDHHVIDRDLIGAQLQRAADSLSTVPALMRPLFTLGVHLALETLASIQADEERGKYRWFELTDNIEIESDEVAAFVQHCRNSAQAGELVAGVTWKVSEQFDRVIHAVYVENVGTLVASKWMGRGETRLSYKPWRTSFFLPSYRDEMVSVALSGQIWRRCYAADKLAFSGKGVASVPTFRYNGREYFISGISSCGGETRAMYGSAWRLAPVAEWMGETHCYESLIRAYDAGTRERGDERGMIVSVRGSQYVVDAAMLVYDLTAADDSLHYAEEEESVEENEEADCDHSFMDEEFA